MRNYNYTLACVSDAQRKLTFLGVDGYDIFGKNKFFAPRVRWNVLEERVEEVKGAAKDYEDAFNNVMEIENIDSNFNKVSVRILSLFSLTTLAVTVWAFDGQRSLHSVIVV